MDIKKTIATSAGVVTAAATATATAVTAKRIKEKKFCPICSAKKIINKAKLTQCAETGYNNGVALTPPMGWSSWNLFRNHISEDLTKEIADAMKASGLADAGYQYVNLDDCWQSSSRDENGKLQSDKVTFPSGIKALSEYVNNLGLKLGIYSSNGIRTCEDYPASLKNEAIDADTFAQWGIEYFKYDFCNNEKIPSNAPLITSVSIAKAGAGKDFITILPSEVKTKGNVRIVKEPDLESGEYLVGLCSHNGSFSIDVDVDDDGEYIITFVIKKDGEQEAFLVAMVNGKDEYHLYSHSKNKFTLEARTQLEVKLNKGANHIEFYNPVGSKMDSAAVQYKLMGRELKRATKEFAEKNGTQEKPIVYSICEWGLNKPWRWGREAGNLWRTTPDIKPIWPSILGIYEVTVRLAKHSAVGGWNDPDMLEVGNGNLSYAENKAHFSLWCMLCAPLILGNDIRKFIKDDGTVDVQNKIYQILTNKDMIAINQDPLGVQCKRIKYGITDVLVKPLTDSRVAICVLNKGNSTSETDIDLGKISNLGYVNLPKKDGYKVVDVWEKKSTVGSSKIKALVEKHGVKVYIVS